MGDRYLLEVLYRGGSRDAQQYGEDLDGARLAVKSFYTALGPFRPVGAYICAHQDTVLLVRVVVAPDPTAQASAMVDELERSMNERKALPWWRRLVS